MKRAALVLAALALLLGGVGQATAGIINGGFESETGNNVGGNTPDGWTLTGNAANYYTGGLGSGEFGINAHSGNYFATFSNFAPGSSNSPSGVSGLEQTVATTSGQQYPLTFWYTANSGATNAEIKATWDGKVLMDLVGDLSSLASGWHKASFTVTGTGSDTVAFSGYADGNYGDPTNGIDDVSLSPATTPEPASLTLLGLGGLGLAGYGWRRRRQAATA